MDFILPSIVATLLLVVLIYHFLFDKKSGQKPPEAGSALPIIGHLHLLAAPRPAFKILTDMADKYGPIFRLRLGSHKVLVVSDSRIVKECFTTNDRALASRPKAIASEVMGYNYAMFGLAPYGQHWRHARKVAMLELLSNRRLEVLRQVWESEVRSFTQDIYRSWVRDKDNESEDVNLDMKEWFGKLTMDIMTKMLFGQRYEEEGNRAVVTTMRRFFDLLGAFVVGDYVPWLRWMDIGGHEKAMRETAKEMDSLVEGWLQEHKRKRDTKPKEEEEDFMDGLLSSIHDGNNDIPKDFGADTIVKATCLAMLTGGTDTTAITLIWALSLLLNNYTVLEKIQAELDIHVGRERRINHSDLNNLAYLQTVVKETLRLYPAGPLAIPHESIDDIIINGYHIPKGTHIFVNISKVQQDPNFWSDPNVFRPERFLNEHKEIDVKGNDFELIPFSSGRRMCPGTSLALQVVELVLASLIQGFDLKRISDEPIDMTDGVGLTNMKATPLFASLTPRLPSHLYN